MEMDSDEGRIQHFDEGSWRLTVKNPLVGYRYRLRWTIPAQSPDEPVRGETRQGRQSRLAMDENPTSGHDKAQVAFGLLVDG